MKRIVVLGAGFAGIKTVVELQKKLRQEVEIILVDRNPYHCETFRLYEVASAKQPYTRISYPISDVIDPKMTTFIQDDVKKIDYKNKKVELAHHKAVKYDYCVVGLGFTLNTFGILGADENALPMYNVKSAEKIGARIVQSMKDYRQTKDPKDLTIVMCGSGFQAVEVTVAIATNREAYAKLAGVKPEEIKVKMLNNSKRMLPMFGDKQLQYALEQIKKNDIEIIDQAKITKIFPDTVYYQHGDDKVDTKIVSNNIIWLMGFSGNPVITASGIKSFHGKATVDGHLTIAESDDIYLCGDVAMVPQPGKSWPWPNTGQLALAMANYAAKDLQARVLGHNRPNDFVYHDLGVFVELGKNAVGIAMGHKLYGYPASVMKKITIDKSVWETGGLKETLAIGRFDMWH
ncbi:MULTISPECIES: NAD(P)/FAD-dependent oxidoreductase [Lactobacillus]|uniref:NAD(P)/FAD-dependent oxidoreductase n=1 Tax=Lactobacillus xujianguonis TaxID=2495899 RepID=A0A437STC9_9LACO|nr:MULTISPECIES: FAD-dependent oxidoreductase [Lactobacillus]RVU70201.1 NAD(P)/FAD-dependent oxidoreductase [Lactobacillus xujianguonis]RVU76914.1 NAD(P)/FAD-dependent oxidoreductase [Lactobacillus xujianguonis]